MFAVTVEKRLLSIDIDEWREGIHEDIEQGVIPSVS